MECSVCMDHVLSKLKLSEFDLPFCVSCIGMNVNNPLRADPMCRKLSYFVTPPVIWYSTSEEKQGTDDSSKAKTKTIDCNYFCSGNGNCPFGTNCFYKHACRAGQLKEVVLASGF
ncbi:hypothetical protein IEQ34_017423 [Dendrobium chrysotoxum]|uniref:C3H1-type domain-containing protein n=1 Tax=Dendrobium chrysotoxum TaxID=161865 RepID=A0AAV7GB98_DENCH|nr:hypothetical protein IEQ34_017423 [Dendrobium chrysotoxum]